MKITKVLITAALLGVNASYAESSTPYEKTQANVYNDYTDEEVPLPAIFKDRRSVTLQSIYKAYGYPPLPSHIPPAWQFKGKTTSAAANGEWFHLYRIHYPNPITQPAKYTVDSKKRKREILKLTIEIRYFPNTRKPPIVYDAFYQVRPLNLPPNDIFNMSNPAFPPIQWDYDILKKFAPYVNATKTEWDRSIVQRKCLDIINAENKARRMHFYRQMRNFKNNILALNKK